jgi:plasmid stabilization system protein ParE
VPKVQYTRRAELDFDEIAACTLEKWGAEQLVRYLDMLQGCCERLADELARAGSAFCVGPM